MKYASVLHMTALSREIRWRSRFYVCASSEITNDMNVIFSTFWFVVSQPESISLCEFNVIGGLAVRLCLCVISRPVVFVIRWPTGRRRAPSNLIHHMRECVFIHSGECIILLYIVCQRLSHAHLIGLDTYFCDIAFFPPVVRHRQQRPAGPEGLRMHGGASVRDRRPRRMQSGQAVRIPAHHAQPVGGDLRIGWLR